MINKSVEIANEKLKTLNTTLDILLDYAEEMRKEKEDIIRTRLLRKSNIMRTASSIGYMEAIEDVIHLIEEQREAYTSLIRDEYDAEVDVLEDEEDFTCYPLDVENVDIDDYDFKDVL